MLFSFTRAQSGFINSFPFDPVGMNSPKHAINEVKNGRLAMVRLLTCRVILTGYNFACCLAVFSSGSDTDAVSSKLTEVLTDCPPHPSKLLSLFLSRQVAFAGFAMQALVSRTQPLEGLSTHIAGEC